MTARLVTPARRLTYEENDFGGVLRLYAQPPHYRTYRLGGVVFFNSDRVGVVEVPEGAETDFASIPRPFWGLLPPCGTYAPAALVHDYLYRTGHTTPGAERAVTRYEADAVFYEAMRQLGTPLLVRLIIWLAVRLFGWLSFHPSPDES